MQRLDHASDQAIDIRPHGLRSEGGATSNKQHVGVDNGHESGDVDCSVMYIIQLSLVRSKDG